MAIQKDTEFTGRIDNLIYYKWKELYCIRTAPAHIRQSEATKQAAKNFGLASAQSKNIRCLLAPLIKNARDKALHVRLRKELMTTLSRARSESGPAGIHPLSGFRFNETAALSHFLLFPIATARQDDDTFNIEIPAIDPGTNLNAPSGATRTQLDFLALRLGLNDTEVHRSTTATINIQLTEGVQEAQRVEARISGTAKGITLLIASLSFWKGNERIASGAYNPVDVISVWLEAAVETTA